MNKKKPLTFYRLAAFVDLFSLDSYCASDIARIVCAKS